MNAHSNFEALKPLPEMGLPATSWYSEADSAGFWQAPDRLWRNPFSAETGFQGWRECFTA